jgi:genome maintenance exonuclease 1
MFEHKPIDLGYQDLKCITKKGAGRKYYTPNNNAYPSITTILSIRNKKAIDAWKKRVGEEEAAKISYRAASRGTAVHEMAEKYVNNDPSYKVNAMPNIIADFNNIKDILDERVGIVYGQELPLYSDHLQLAGRVDCVAEWDGVLSIIDYKTSKKAKRKDWITNYFIQETFYAIAWEERTGLPITQLVTVIAVDNDSPQVFIEHRDNWDKELIKAIKDYNEKNGIN